MILIDWSNIMISNIMLSIKLDQQDQPPGAVTKMADPKSIRLMMLSSLRMYRSKYHRSFGELVLCIDGWSSWRKEIFPHYKASRKANREESELDWKALFAMINEITKEIEETFPYKMIKINTAEADDVIGTLATKYHRAEKTIIISSDKDFIQLQRYKGVKQYSPKMKKMIGPQGNQSPAKFLQEHIMRGDSGDGIPNFLSPGNSFVDKIRQKSLMTKDLTKWLKSDQPFGPLDEEYPRWQENQKLIDLSFTPADLKEKIINKYEEPAKGHRSKILNYLVKNRLKTMIENLGDF